MKQLTTEQRVKVVSALVEGCSINSTVRMTGVTKPTILRLIGLMGDACQQYHNENVHTLNTERVQLDEIWSFCYCKAEHVTTENYADGRGDVWTWMALDADSKLVINWLVGNRGGACANVFVADLAERLNDRVQITSDGWEAYRTAINKAFGTDVDYAMLIKEYAAPRGTHARYSPPECVSCHTRVATGSPDPKHISTSFVERQNLTMRMSMRRFTRLTNGFSKKIQNHEHAISLYSMHYNFCRKHITLKGKTPAMVAGLADHVWSIEELVGLLNVSSLV